MFDNHHAPVEHVQYQQQQIQRHEIARIQQVISETEWHLQNLHRQATSIGQNMEKEEERQEYANLLFTLNQTSKVLRHHYDTLNEMIRMANLSFGRNLPEQCRREIYHLYHAGRYNQSQLASHYDVSQSAVSKIVNGPEPAQIGGVNPQSVASP
ncbi:hypothetical protein [Halochromatium glycolicum]|uniref:hypothetical protein n=1 Tax=Halochromatium glycolicum TaxID=85075 RepID=UPI00190C0F18|nr:hypothetical protein [Halochromatium glycolicum]